MAAQQTSSTRLRREAEHVDRIRALKADLGERLIVLTHHYQRPEIVAIGDLKGDSFALSKAASEQAQAEYIVFCGVHFMAESAVVLARPGQRVFHPNPAAGCPMADMVERPDAELAWSTLGELFGEGAVIPVTYMNSPASVKAFCGENGGVVCTSSNAPRAFAWAFEQGERVLFMPDEHLGRNTATAMGIPDEEIVLWDPAAPDRWGGNDPAAVGAARVLLWKGYCHVHTWFETAHIEAARARVPGCRVVVHPECRREVVQAADGNGSTDYLVRYVADAPAGSTIVIGTEVNLIQRLAAEHPDKHVEALSRSLCPNMFRITLGHLRKTLEGLPEVNRVIVAATEREGAKVALDRMLALP